jgi:hypothetical protein
VITVLLIFTGVLTSSLAASVMVALGRPVASPQILAQLL